MKYLIKTLQTLFLNQYNKKYKLGDSMDLKKIIKTPTKPIAKKIRHIAEAAIHENTQIASAAEQITTLKTENEKLHKNLEDLETNFDHLKSNLDNLELNLKYIYYYHGGSGNHGCEALVRTVTNIINTPIEHIGLYSSAPNEDKIFGILDKVSFIKQSTLSPKDLLKKYRTGTIALSIGGDNYCYYPDPGLANTNRSFHKANAKTALIGCSIDTEIFNHPEVLGDLCQYDLITARESLTYNNLIKNGLSKNTILIPDSAFTLEKEASGIKLKPNTIGINISNLSMSASSNILYDNILYLIKYLLNQTSYNIALIPHVHQKYNDDYEILNKIYKSFDENERITLISTTFNACQLKDIISQCQMLVATRTHCSIAGYSSYVPTLVLGYSIKSIGIAKDIFGTDENYVISVQNIRNKDSVQKSFLWLEKNQSNIKKHLTKIIPSYSKKAHKLQQEIMALNKTTSPKTIPQPAIAKIGKYRKGVLSIITSCFNCEDYIHRYFDSILSQTNKNIQLIIVNDGSTDHTEEIILNYKYIFDKKGIELIYLKQQNTGLGGAYDLALKYVSGEFFCWYDSDDLKTPDFVDDILNYFKQYPERNIVRFDAYFVPEQLGDNPDLLNMHNFEKFSSLSHNTNARKLFMAAILEKNWFFGNTVAIRTKEFDKVSSRTVFHSRAGQNWQLCLPMLYNHDAYFIPKVYNYIIMRQNSVSRINANKKDLEALIRQYDEYEKILSNVLTTINPDNLDYLLCVIKQKYITLKLKLAKEYNNKEYIDYYNSIYTSEVENNNLYKSELEKIK